MAEASTGSSVARRGVRRLLGALALGAALMLGGCMSIPTDGAVLVDGLPLGEEGALSYLPQGPQAGASQLEILQGFIQAGTRPQDGYRVASEFLSSSFAPLWQPSSAVLVTSSRQPPEVTGDDEMSLTVTLAARVEANGSYRPTNSGSSSQQTLEFSFVEEGGQWRIDSAPDTTILSTTQFGNVFSPYSVYFFDPSYAFLVPELRWFPELPTTGNRIVRSLLVGQSSWLGSGAVLTAFPTGTTLVGGVEIDSGMARVDLSSEVLAESDVARQRMVQQLSASLAALGNVQTVELTVDELPVDIGVEGERAERDPQVDALPLVYSNGTLGFAADDQLFPLVSAPVLESLEPIAAALSRDRATLALLGAGGVSRVSVPGGAQVLVDERPGLAAPALDPHGFVWTVPSDRPREILISSADESQLSVESSLPADATLVALRLSRDGTRVLAYLHAESGPSLVVAAIERDAQLRPISLGAPLSLPVPPGEALDAAWVDGSTVATLSDGVGGPRVTAIEVGGVVTELGGVADAVAIVGGNFGTQGLNLLDLDGVVRQPNASGGWQTTVRGAEFLVVLH